MGEKSDGVDHERRQTLSGENSNQESRCVRRMADQSGISVEKESRHQPILNDNSILGGDDETMKRMRTTP